MKLRKIISVISLISLLAVAIAGVGCGGEGGGAADITNMMKNVPDDATYFYFMDAKSMRADDDLIGLYASWEDDSTYMSETYNITWDDVNSLTQCGDDTTLLEGNFDLDKVRSKLEDGDYTKGKYGDVELWESDYLWVALMDDLIITGSEEAVKDCIGVIKDEKDSLADNRDVKVVMDRLPSGILTGYDTDEEYKDLVASGLSIQKKSKDTVKGTAVYKFKDENAAENAIEAIKGDLEENKSKNIDIKQDGEFVIATAETDMNELFTAE